MLAIEPNLLLFETHTMREHMSVMLLPTTAGATLVMVFCGLGLLLAAVGLYGVIAFSVARRTREIGIRIAIGARPGAVLAGVMRQGLTLAVLGLVAGFALAAVVAQVLAGLLYGISPIDPVAWSAATLVLLSVAALANLMPAYRAMQVDPVERAARGMTPVARLFMARVIGSKVGAYLMRSRRPARVHVLFTSTALVLAVLTSRPPCRDGGKTATSTPAAPPPRRFRRRCRRFSGSPSIACRI